MRLNEQVKDCLSNTKSWVLATCGDTPNVVTIMFHEIGEQDELVFYHVFMKKTIENIKAGSTAAVLVNPEGKMEGYQLKGAASYTTDPAYIARGNAMAEKVGLHVSGAVIVNVDTVIVLTPGPDNGKVL